MSLGEDGSPAHLASVGAEHREGHSVRRARGPFRTPTVTELSDYMRTLAQIRWAKYRDRVECGEITAENYVYRPRGPMPPEVKAKQEMTRWQHQIASVRLIRLALDGRKLSPRRVERIVAETTTGRKKQRPHMRFGGKPPKHWHSVHYRPFIERTAGHIREQLTELGIQR
jgi:hypothetical protein